MSTDWVNLVKSKVKQLLPAPVARETQEAADETTPLALLNAIWRAGLAIRSDDGKLAVTPPGRLTERQKTQIREWKARLLVLLKPQPSTDIAGWEQEWAFEREVLERRLAATNDPEAIASLEYLLTEDPHSEEHWLKEIAPRISTVECNLRERGILPPVIYAGDLHNGAIKVEEGAA